MNLEASLAACEDTVKRIDADRYISALFAPAGKRPLLFALYAFNHELAHIGETVKEPMLAQLRREWWREAIESAQAGRPHPHGVVCALSEIFRRSPVPVELFDEMIAARSADAESLPFAEMSELEVYADHTSANLMRIAALILGHGSDDDALLRHAGIAYALIGLVRSWSVHAARGKSFVPRTLSAEKDNSGAALAMIECASRHHAAARRLPMPGPLLPAILPAALVPLYAKHFLAKDGELHNEAPDMPLFRRQWTMLQAAIRGRI